MNVSLTPKLEQMVREKVECGDYSSASEVVREALRLLDEREQEELNYRLDAALKAGIQQLEEGNTIPYSREYFEQVVKRGFELANSDLSLDPDVAPID